MREPPKSKVFLEGRYRKLCRDLPQTVFFCPDCKGHPRRRKRCERCEGYGKLTRDSVQELVGWVVGRAFKTRKNKFHGAGREDVDVRMLGEGRPFVIEVIAPKVFDVDLAEVEAEINRRNEGRLEILGLHWTEKERVRALKESQRPKEYEALVGTEEAIGAGAAEDLVGERFEVTQRTPGRVAHRRADRERRRWVEILALWRDEESGPNRWRVRLRTQHGTYVKEVLHGDEGKTQPSLGDLLGARCRCIELDVISIGEPEDGEEVPARPPPFGAGV